MSAKVYVIGAGMTTFGAFPETEVHALAQQAVWEAINSAGVDPRRLEVCYAGHAYQGPCFGQKTLCRLGLTGMPVVNVENACASGGSAILGVSSMIKSGQADLGIALGGEKLTSPSGGFLPLVSDDLDSSMGRVMPAAFAMMARRHMEMFGTTIEQIAMVSIKNYNNGLLNPRCHMKRKITVEEVLNSPIIADPLTRLCCCPISDGAAAVILASEKVARQYTSKPVELVASVLNSGKRVRYNIINESSEMSIRAAKAAYEIAGLGPRDIDVCELHDPFSIAEIVHCEDLGFCGLGEGGPFVAEGRSALDGEVAVSPSGGLMAKGHPLGATGVAQVAEIFWQLRGEAGSRQVPGAKVGLAHTIGGGVSRIESGACSVQILKI